ESEASPKVAMVTTANKIEKPNEDNTPLDITPAGFEVLKDSAVHGMKVLKGKSDKWMQAAHKYYAADPAAQMTEALEQLANDPTSLPLHKITCDKLLLFGEGVHEQMLKMLDPTLAATGSKIIDEVKILRRKLLAVERDYRDKAKGYSEEYRKDQYNLLADISNNFSIAYEKLYSKYQDVPIEEQQNNIKEDLKVLDDTMKLIRILKASIDVLQVGEETVQKV
ncbi:unnamed protein product, partial [marine sediment metagenome]